MEKSSGVENKIGRELSPAEKYCEPYYKEFVKEEILKKSGFKKNEELMKAVVNGKINFGEIKSQMMSLKDFTAYYFPKELPPETRLRDEYSVSEVIDVGAEVTCFNYLANGDVISGDMGGKIYRFYKGVGGKYSREEIGTGGGWISTLQVLANGDVISGGDDGKIYRFHKGVDGKYSREEIGIGGGWISTLQVLANGDVISGDMGRKIYRFYKGVGGKYSREEIGTGDGLIYTLQVLANGDVISGGKGGKITIWR